MSTYFLLLQIYIYVAPNDKPQSAEFTDSLQYIRDRKVQNAKQLSKQHFQII